MPTRHTDKCKVMDGDEHKYIEYHYDQFETIEDLQNHLTLEDILVIVNFRLQQKAATAAKQEFYDSQSPQDEQEPPTS
jgi:hypothetical protein